MARAGRFKKPGTVSHSSVLFVIEALLRIVAHGPRYGK
jgi:hypothetical protein